MLCSKFVTYVSQICLSPNAYWGFSGGSNSKESACNAGDPGLILGLWRSSGEGNGNPLHYSCLENSMDRGIYKFLQFMGMQRVGQDWATDTFTQIECNKAISLSWTHQKISTECRGGSPRSPWTTFRLRMWKHLTKCGEHSIKKENLEWILAWRT